MKEKKCGRNKKFLDRIKLEGKKIEINDDSKIVLISDVHRGDGGYADSLRTNENMYKAALKYYLNNGFYLLEVGDGDELWKNKNCKDIAYNYEDIFYILNKFKEKDRLCLIYGNHDMIKASFDFSNKQKKILKKVSYNFGKRMIDLYCDMNFYEGAVLKYTPCNREILVFHGHQVDMMNCQLWKLSRFLVRYLWRILEGTAGFKAPTSPANNYDKGDKIDKILNNLSKKEKQMIICGHTHNDKLPDVGEGLYFNDGCCVFPSSITAIEIEKGMISLVKWKIEVNENSMLYINKSIIGGPNKIQDYFCDFK